MFHGQVLFNQPGQLVIGRVIQDLKTLGTIVIGPGVFLPTGTGPDRLPRFPDRFRYRPVSNRPKFKIQIWIKKMKKSQKIPKNTSSCDESNGVNIFQIFVHLVYFAGIWS